MGSTTKPIVAFIPVRGGSKSIPLKNIKPLAGRPLVYWTTKACSDSKTIHETFVATDSDEIRDCVDNMYLPRVKVIDRSPETATDSASTESALLEFAEKHQFKYICLVQATSPLTTSTQIDDAFQKFFNSGADALLSVVRTKRFMWAEEGGLVRPANYDPQRRPRRQEWVGQLVENGAFYITSREKLLESRCRISGKIAAYEMPEETYLEIDEPIDWQIIDELLRNRNPLETGYLARLQRLRLICVDVDGTLTDGGMYYTEAGESMKRFDTRDAAGLEALRVRGIEPAFITRENSPIVVARARKLNLKHVYVGVEDKVQVTEKLLAEMNLDWEQVAYIGDDIHDLPVIKQAGFSACPADAAPEVVDSVTYICQKTGGHGAVREVCDLIKATLGS